VEIDVFTLFPQWFDWFRTQRHVANALGLGHTFECVDYRATTPLKAGEGRRRPVRRRRRDGAARRRRRGGAARRYGADPSSCASAPRDRADAGRPAARRRARAELAPSRL
jgi:tRNA (guanine37-N1)-methyltransferase